MFATIETWHTKKHKKVQIQIKSKLKISKYKQTTNQYRHPTVNEPIFH